MKFNLYGVASIQLDRLKGTKIRKILLALTSCKLLSLKPTLFINYSLPTILTLGNVLALSETLISY